PPRDRANRAPCGDRRLWPHDRAHRFFSPARRNPDDLRLTRDVIGAESAGSAVALTEGNRLRISQARTLPAICTPATARRWASGGAQIGLFVARMKVIYGHAHTPGPGVCNECAGVCIEIIEKERARPDSSCLDRPHARVPVLPR